LLDWTVRDLAERAVEYAGVESTNGDAPGGEVEDEMTSPESALHVEVLDDELVITLPGTSYAVTYYRATAFPQRLLTKSHSGGEDHDAPMTQAEFHGRAWRLANDKARELGWIV